MQQWQSLAPVRTALATTALLLGGTAGTGGDLPPDSVRTYAGTGAVRTVEVPRRNERRTASKQLDMLRTTLRLSVAELGQLMQVTRQAVHGWMRGNAMAEQHAARLGQLSAAIGRHQDLLLAQGGRIARRLFDGRQSLLDLLSQSGDPAAVVDRLANVLTIEQAQRDRLVHRLKGRKPSASSDLDALG